MSNGEYSATFEGKKKTQIEKTQIFSPLQDHNVLENPKRYFKIKPD